MMAIQARESIVGECCRRCETGAVKLAIGITITRSGSVRFITQVPGLVSGHFPHVKR